MWNISIKAKLEVKRITSETMQYQQETSALQQDN